jgi:polyphenol oxidase
MTDPGFLKKMADLFGVSAYWQPSPSVMAFTSARRVGGRPVNFGLRCGANVAQALQQRSALQTVLGKPVRWLNQVHGIKVATDSQPELDPADAAVSKHSQQALAVLSADCLPVVFSSAAGNCLAVAHAGWRGLLHGVLQATVNNMRLEHPSAELHAWIGPHISQANFEVGDELRQAFVSLNPDWQQAFLPGKAQGKWQADLAAITTWVLKDLGVQSVSNSGLCTFADPGQFYSYRRDHDQQDGAGRMATVVLRFD